MLRTIHLHGRLGKKFAKTYQFDCTTPAEAFRAMLYQLPGFRAELEKGEYRVRAVVKGHSTDFDEDMLHLDLSNADLHVTPLVAGRANKGGTKAILGVLLIAVAIVFTAGAAGGLVGVGGGLVSGSMAAGFTLTGWGMVAALGASLVLSGVAMMLSPIPKTGNKRKESFLFNGAENVYEQGGPVPLVYGRHLVGSTVVSAGIATEDVYVAAGDTYTDDSGQTFIEGDGQNWTYQTP